MEISNNDHPTRRASAPGRRKARALVTIGLVLLLGACAGGADGTTPTHPARLTSVDKELPEASTTTAERISPTTTEAPTTTAAPTTTVPPTTTTAPPPPPPPPPTTAKPQPIVATTAAPPPTTAAPSTSSTYYAKCDDARAAGAAPLYRGDPGYRSGLDRDNDGIACE